MAKKYLAEVLHTEEHGDDRQGHGQDNQICFFVGQYGGEEADDGSAGGAEHRDV